MTTIHYYGSIKAQARQLPAALEGVEDDPLQMGGDFTVRYTQKGRKVERLICQVPDLYHRVKSISWEGFSVLFTSYYDIVVYNLFVKF